MLGQTARVKVSRTKTAKKPPCWPALSATKSASCTAKAKPGLRGAKCSPPGPLHLNASASRPAQRSLCKRLDRCLIQRRHNDRRLIAPNAQPIVVSTTIEHRTVRMRCHELQPFLLRKSHGGWRDAHIDGGAWQKKVCTGGMSEEGRAPSQP